uniref:Uncharacterized protein n=1 Tax=Panagrolaimus superbus TaxID=310955 RepID=A0A914Z5Q7_9BILA
MDQCLDFASSSSNIFAYIQKKNGADSYKLYIYTAFHGTTKLLLNKNQKDQVLVEVFVNELDQKYEVIFEGIKYLTFQYPSAITCIVGKPVIVEVMVDIPYLEYPILPPPNLAELLLTESFLKCLRCGNILADPHPNYFVVLEQAEEIMETAMGCCRCCSSSAESHKCEHIRSPDTGKIFLDDGIILVTEDYLKKDSYIKLDRNPLIECLKCYQKAGPQNNEYFGFEKNPSKHIEIFPMQADFVDKHGNSMIGNSYECWSHYFATRLMSTGLDNYALITDGIGNPHVQVGFFFRRLLWFGDAGSNSLRKVTALCFFYTENHTVMQTDLNIKIRLPKAAIKTFQRYLEQTHQLLKPFTPGYGQWKSAFFSLDCNSTSSLLINEPKISL